jgi:phenylacetate-CoA ligase
MQPAGAVWRKNAAAILLRGRMGWEPGDRAAGLWGAVEDLPTGARDLRGRLKEAVLARIEPMLWLPAADLSDARLDSFASRLRRFAPLVLQAYPSAADLLARRVLARGEPLRIPLVILTAETVFPAQRERIAAALGARVHSFYGAREVGWIAGECVQEERLHLNTDGIHLEIDAAGRILVTDLINRAMPLIRYAVGDRGALAEGSCPCGDPRPVLSALHGRVNDVFLLPSGRRVPGSICDVRNYQLVDGIVETQLVQEVVDRLHVRWVAGANYRPEHLDTLRRFLDDSFGGELSYDFERVARIEPEPNGKTRYCISRLGAIT